MIELRAMASLPSDAVLADQPLDDRVARVTIREGDVLRDLSLESPMLVERQQIVDVQVVRGAIVVHTRGVALEPGRRGDVIRVRSATSETVFTAMVQSIGRVEVP
jgi:flagella basal body P-ring formation protein FlgA